MGAILGFLLLWFFFYLIFSGSSSSAPSTTGTTSTQTVMAMNSTTMQHVSHCSEAALFMSWMNPTISVVFVVLGFFALYAIFWLVHEFLVVPLKHLVDFADSRIRNAARRVEAETEAAAVSGGSNTYQSRAGAGSESTHAESFRCADAASHEEAPADDASETASNAETMVDGSSSREQQSKHEEERLLETDPISSEPVALKPKPQSAISAMTAEEIRQLSHIFMQTSIFTFGFMPFFVFIMCLWVNNANFCTGFYARYPEDLKYMLWVLVPGYIAWSGLVILVWGEALTVVLGKDKQLAGDGVMMRLQWQLAFIIQPVLVILWFGGLAIYYQGVERLYQYFVGVMERRIAGGQHEYRPPGEGDTMLLPLSEGGR